MYKNSTKFEWDPDKDIANQRKHYISFEASTYLWQDPDRMEITAPHPLENRHAVIGRIQGQIWTAIYTMRQGTIHIISVRRARQQEQEIYEHEKNGQ